MIEKTSFHKWAMVGCWKIMHSVLQKDFQVRYLYLTKLARKMAILPKIFSTNTCLSDVMGLGKLLLEGTQEASKFHTTLLEHFESR